MDAKELARRMRYGTLACLTIAAAISVWAIVLGAEELSSSAPAGVAVIVIAILLLGGIAWRIQFSWNRIHSRG